MFTWLYCRAKELTTPIALALVAGRRFARPIAALPLTCGMPRIAGMAAMDFRGPLLMPRPGCVRGLRLPSLIAVG